MKEIDKKESLEMVDEKNIGRLTTIFIIIGIILFLLIGRIYYIQIINGKSLREMAMKQWFKTIETIEQRGYIFDRNKIPFTNTVKEDYLIIQTKDIDEGTIEALGRVTDYRIEDLREMISRMDDEIRLPIKNYNSDELKQVVSNRYITILEKVKRYNQYGIASHVIGYINKSNNSGESGLEKYFNSQLTEGRYSKIGVVVDAKNKVLPGMGYINLESNEGRKKNIVTTLDYKVQDIIEKNMDKNNYNGSIVVLNGNKGDILGMVSRPNFDQENIGSHLNSRNRELYNKGIQITYPPGSIFKMIIAAVALEEDAIDEEHRFICEGFEDLSGTIIKCNAFDKGGHGKIDFQEAFSDSCNSAFIQMGKMVGGEKIIELASKFGLGSKTGIPIEGEASGVLPTYDYIKGPGIGNTSIGQGMLEVTPLQVARMTNVFINRGIDVGINLVTRIEDDQGEIIEEFITQKSSKVISAETAEKVRKMMEAVVIEGTGKRAGMDGVESGGKTGSAEAISGNGPTVHAWFTGFFIGDKSNYIVTIVVEDGEGGGQTAAPIFKSIVEDMIDLKY